jgi:hypothetical protein
LREVMVRHITQGIVSMEDVGKFTRAASRAQFLFGSEVTNYLERTRLDLSRNVVDVTHRPGTEIPEPQRKAAEDKMVTRLDRLSAFFDDFDVLVAPYMKHTQKRVQIPFIDA